MDRAGLGAKRDQLHGDRPLHLGNAYLANSQPSPSQRGGRGINLLGNARLHLLDNRPSQDANPQAAGRRSSGAPSCVHADHHIQEQARIAHRPGQRTGVVERPAQGKRPLQGDQTKRGLQPDAATEGGRDPDRSTGVRAKSAGAEPGHHRDRRTAARAPGAAPGVMRVAGDPPPGIGIADAVGELVKVGLPEDDGAGRPESGDYGGIPRGNPVLKDARPRRRAHAAGGKQVFDGNRHAQQRSRFTPRQPALRPPGLPPSPLPGQRDKGVQAARRFDAPAVGVHQLERGDRAPAKRPGDLGHRCLGQRLNRRHPHPQAPLPLSVRRPGPGTASRPAAGKPRPGRSAEGRRLVRRPPVVPSPSPGQYAIRGGWPVNGSIITCECEMV